MRVVQTDNFNRDYPDERFFSGPLAEKEARDLANKLNMASGPYGQDYYQVVDDDYVLAPRFEP